eukprot:11370446-Karenia_brevis.AAC.1
MQGVGDSVVGIVRGSACFRDPDSHVEDQGKENDVVNALGCEPTAGAGPGSKRKWHMVDHS